jgi:NAD(P)-dependent dehydrogenase (short-subunit alcohol dehydrogenase family)
MRGAPILRGGRYGQVQGRVAIVTGGASGVGAACAATLAREGAKVTDLGDARGEAVVTEIVSAGGEAVFLYQDVSLEENWPSVIEATERRFGRLELMVANAGIGIMCKAVEMSLADWRRQTAVNLDGVFLSVKYGIPAKRRAVGLHHHYVIRCRPPGIGRISRLLRNKGRPTPVREGGRDGVRGRSRRDTGQYGSSRCHRHADLDEAIRVRWAQRADRPERGG